MFIGHFGFGFAAKRVAPDVSLGVLLAAALLPDLLWAALLLAGLEQVRIAPGNTAFTPLAFVHYPISHSLWTVVGWSVLAAALYQVWKPEVAGAWTISLLVISHWVLDAVAHRPDLPILPGWNRLVGLGLWNSVGGTLIVEGGLFVVGVWLYLNVTRTRDAAGRYGLYALTALLLGLYAASAIGPAPPSVAAIAWSDLAALLLLFWAGWVDCHREAVSAHN